MAEARRRKPIKPTTDPDAREPITEEDAAFLAALERHEGQVTGACKETGFPRWKVYARRSESKSFAAAMSDIEAAVWPEIADDWLEAFERTCSVANASASIGLRRSAPYEMRERYPWFAERWDAIDRSWLDRLKGGIMTRALEGVEKIAKVGKTVLDDNGSEKYEYGVIGRHYSLAREKFVLERLDPEQWGDKARVSQTPADTAASIAAMLAEMEGSVEGEEPGPEEGE
jgi:hypothetical protein